jgi:hypothetical protein|tara:strand:- start:14316 stop:14582 length:267 start_codon:yes stop_codon:yes gene_type:complete
MNYYIVTTTTFNTLTKSNIKYVHTSNDGTKKIIITSDTVDSPLNTFVNTTTLSEYTFTNNSDWVGDGTGIAEWNLEVGEVIYDSNIDD